MFMKPCSLSVATKAHTREFTFSNAATSIDLLPVIGMRLVMQESSLHHQSSIKLPGLVGLDLGLDRVCRTAPSRT